ncbi:general amino acid permease (Agp2) [Apiospora arundinis]
MPRRFIHTHTYELVKESDMNLYMKWHYRQQVKGTPSTQAVYHSYSYAILSHTWLENNEKTASKEVTYLDMKTSFSDLKLGRLKKAGWRKVEEFCKLARTDGFQWAWMDTCCIDKRSTSETQEAINAMFRWYRDAAICYAHLQDVHVHGSLPPTGWGYHDEDKHCQEFKMSNWFKRSWTLQELLAPHDIMFVDTNWTPIGTKDQWAEGIQIASNIESRYLKQFENCSIAQKLSWAADRDATIPEDRAYSLLGLFGISMPLSYGEGPMAFIRFQHELLRSQDDDSLLSWLNAEEEKKLYSPPGILAPSVSCFKGAQNVEKPEPGRPKNTMFSMTNRGLQMSKATIHKSSESPVCIVELDCFRKPTDPEEKERRCRLLLKKADGEDHNCYERLTIKERDEYNLPELDIQQDSAKWFDPRGRGTDPFLILQPNGDPSYLGLHELRVYLPSDVKQDEDSENDSGYQTKIDANERTRTDHFGETYITLRTSENGESSQPHNFILTAIRKDTEKEYLFDVQLHLKESMEVCCKVAKTDSKSEDGSLQNATSMVELESAITLLLRVAPEPVRNRVTPDGDEGEQEEGAGGEESSGEGLGYINKDRKQRRRYRLSAKVYQTT